MFKIISILVVYSIIAKAAPPHHEFAESPDELVREFGNVIDQLLIAFSKGKLLG